MHNLWRMKMTKQGYNHIDRSIQKMSGFFETRVENLETLAQPPAIMKPPKKKKKGNSK